MLQIPDLWALLGPEEEGDHFVPLFETVSLYACVHLQSWKLSHFDWKRILVWRINSMVTLFCGYFLSPMQEKIGAQRVMDV